MTNGFGNLMGQQQTAPTSQNKFQDLLEQARMRQAEGFAREPSIWEDLGDLAELGGAAYRGQGQYTEAKQAQSRRQALDQEGLHRFLSSEDTRALEYSKQAMDRQIAAGDALAAEIRSMFPETDQGNTNYANFSRMYALGLSQIVASNPGITDDDQIPIQVKRDLVRQVGTMFGPATAPPETQSIVVRGTDPINAQFGLGIGPGETARVDITKDSEGNITSASVAAGFGGQDINVYGDKVELQEDILFAGQQDKVFEEVRKNYNTASKTEQTLGLLKASLDSDAFGTGFGAETALFLSQMVEFFGGDPSNWPGLGDPSVGENLQAAADQLALDRVTELPRLTNMSIELSRNAGPRLLRTVRGNKLIVDLMIKKNKRDMERGRFANQFVKNNKGYTAKDGTTLIEALDKWDIDNPGWTNEDRENVLAIAHERGQTIGEAVGDTKVKFPKFVGEVDRMSDKEVISFFRNLPDDDSSWEEFKKLYPEVSESLRERYIVLTEPGG
jgi:hypothetical protein